MCRHSHIYVFSAVVCLLLGLGAVCARAELDEDGFMPLTNGPVPPFQGMVLTSEVRNYTVYYPAVGVKEVDQIIADWAADLVADAPAEALATGQDGNRFALYEMQARYSLSAAQARYFSVVFFTTQTVMDRRENIIYTLNFDLVGRKAVDLKDIFQDLAQSLPQLPALIIQAATASPRADGSPMPLPYYVENYSDYKDEFARFLTVAFCPEGLNVYLSPTDVVLLRKEDLRAAGARGGIW